MPVSVESRFQDAISHLRRSGAAIGVAVSGGSDSMALLRLAAKWGASHDAAVHAVTVDHQLRTESAQEADQVAAQCVDLGVEHTILRWDHQGIQGNTQNLAREARRSLIASWAREHMIETVLFGHTMDDQAETVLLRLARGSGVDGLAVMQPCSQIGAITACRPLLGITRAELQAYLRSLGRVWIDDPSNDDLKFDRIKARKMMDALGELGLTSDRLVQTASHMSAARNTLRQAAAAVAAKQVTIDRCDLIFMGDWPDFDVSDSPQRLFSAAVKWFSNAPHRPRFNALHDAWTQAWRGETVTLGGVLISPENGGGIRLTREVAATEPVMTSNLAAHDGRGIAWDHRWVVEKPDDDGALRENITVSALGAAISECVNWREIGLPRRTLMATPAVWRDNVLIAAPAAGYMNGWQARFVADFHDSLLAH